MNNEVAILNFHIRKFWSCREDEANEAFIYTTVVSTHFKKTRGWI